MGRVFRRLGLFVGATVVLVLVTLVLPSAQAGAVPLPLRVAGSARLAADGPAPEQYPFRVGRTPALDAYGFVTGQCTSFAAWWLNRRGVPFGVVTVGPTGTGRFLNASTWDEAAREAGYAVGFRPVVGALAQWHAGESSLRLGEDGLWHRLTAGEPGHVAVVVRVLPDGQAEWVEYGWGGKPVLHRGYGFAPRYLYIGVTPPVVTS